MFHLFLVLDLILISVLTPLCYSFHPQKQSKKDKKYYPRCFGLKPDLSFLDSLLNEQVDPGIFVASDLVIKKHFKIFA